MSLGQLYCVHGLCAALLRAGKRASARMHVASAVLCTHSAPHESLASMHAQDVCSECSGLWVVQCTRMLVWEAEWPMHPACWTPSKLFCLVSCAASVSTYTNPSFFHDTLHTLRARMSATRAVCSSSAWRTHAHSPWIHSRCGCGSCMNQQGHLSMPTAY